MTGPYWVHIDLNKLDEGSFKPEDYNKLDKITCTLACANLRYGSGVFCEKHFKEFCTRK